MDYRNPVLPGCHPDPTVCRAGEDYYLATSTFEYFPGVPLYHSENLADWEPIGHALTRDEQVPLADVPTSKGVFAPTLRHHEGRFYLVTTNVTAGGHFVVTAEDPRGEWSDPVWIDAPGYDPDLFWDDGQAYVTYANDDAIRQTTVDLDTGETGETGESATIWEGLDDAFTEAPHLYEVDGTYYLLAAEGGTHTQHVVSVARSDDPTGPFEDHPDNPIFSHRSRVLHPIAATGHGDLVQAHDGSWWMTFLAVRKQGEHVPYHTLGRETFLAPVTWADGWPVVNGGDLVELTMSVDDTELDATGDRSWTRTVDPFANAEDRDDLGPEWNYRRNPDRDRYRIQGDALVLSGGPDALDDRHPTFVGRRQQHHHCHATCRLSFDPGPGEEAGLTALMNEDHHYDVAVVERGGERRAVARLRIGPATEEVDEIALPEGPVDLSIEATPESYALFAGPPDGAPAELATADARYLSTEVATGFTGVYIGLYATGGGSESESPARFTDFEYAPTER